MSTYLILILCIVPAVFILFIILNAIRSDRRGVVAAAVSFPLCALLGFVSAKLFYFLLIDSAYVVETIAAGGDWGVIPYVLFDLRPECFCFVGGAVGVWLGLLLSAKITGYRPTGTLADRFVLPGVLLIAGLRMAEIELGSLGLGRFIETPADSSYLILAVYNQYGEPHVAVFLWEALAAVIVGLFALRGREERPGLRFEKAVFHLCVCQILLENMRYRFLNWGFVRVDQLLCAVILMVLLLIACSRSTKKQGASRYLPAVYLFICIAAIVGIEFFRQRSPSRFVGEHGGYLMMGAVLCVMLFIYHRLVLDQHRRPHTNQQTEDKPVF